MVYPLALNITRIQIVARQRSHERKRITSLVGRDKQILPLLRHTHHILNPPDTLQLFFILNSDIQIRLIHIPRETLERTAVAVGREISHIGVGIVHKLTLILYQIDIRLHIGRIQLYILIGKRTQLQISLVGQDIIGFQMKQTGSQPRSLQFQLTVGIQQIVIHHQCPFMLYPIAIHGKRLFCRSRQHIPLIFQIRYLHLLSLCPGPATFNSIHQQQRCHRQHRVGHHQNRRRLKTTSVQLHFPVSNKPLLAQLNPVFQISLLIERQSLIRRLILHTQRIIRHQL